VLFSTTAVPNGRKEYQLLGRSALDRCPSVGSPIAEWVSHPSRATLIPTHVQRAITGLEVTTNAALVRRMYDRFNARDIDGIFSVLEGKLLLDETIAHRFHFEGDVVTRFDIEGASEMSTIGH
jgi:hypothetical protein